MQSHDTVFVVAHADNETDNEQKLFFERLSREIPVCPGADFVNLMDTNNVLCSEACRRGVSGRVCGVSADRARSNSANHTNLLECCE